MHSELQPQGEKCQQQYSITPGRAAALKFTQGIKGGRSVFTALRIKGTL